MQNPTTPACACVNCLGAGCTCSCQTPATQQQTAANPATQCACGPACACQAAAGACRRG